MPGEKLRLTEELLLDPHARVRQLSDYGRAVEVNRSVPVKRYLRSGRELARQASVYYKEGQLDNAFILYNKFCTLYVEKLPKHPEYSKHNVGPEKATIKKLLKEAFPRAMELKEKLLSKFEAEKELYEKQKEEARREKEENEERRKLEEQKKAEADQKKTEELAAFLAGPAATGGTDANVPPSPSSGMEQELPPATADSEQQQQYHLQGELAPGQTPGDVVNVAKDDQEGGVASQEGVVSPGGVVSQEGVVSPMGVASSQEIGATQGGAGVDVDDIPMNMNTAYDIEMTGNVAYVPIEMGEGGVPLSSWTTPTTEQEEGEGEAAMMVSDGSPLIEGADPPVLEAPSTTTTVTTQLEGEAVEDEERTATDPRLAQVLPQAPPPLNVTMATPPGSGPSAAPLPSSSSSSHPLPSAPPPQFDSIFSPPVPPGGQAPPPYYQQQAPPLQVPYYGSQFSAQSSGSSYGTVELPLPTYHMAPRPDPSPLVPFLDKQWSDSSSGGGVGGGGGSGGSSFVPSIDRSLKPSSPSVLSTSLGYGVHRPVFVPADTSTRFEELAFSNTALNIETCGILAGTLSQNELRVTHIIIPKQTGTPDSCETMEEEELFDVQDKYDLITLGWIHTHPTQTAFMSSVDLHTHCSYQVMLDEAIAIVCAPKFQDVGIFSLTEPHGMDYISGCCEAGFHSHPKEPPLYQKSKHVCLDGGASVRIVDLR